MEAIRKQATRLREQVARQQQAVLKQFGAGGYGGSDNLGTDEAELQQHQKLEKLYISTRAGKHYQRDIVRGVEGYIVTGSKQVEIGTKLSEDSKKYGAENTCTSGSTLSRASLSYGRARAQMEKEWGNLLKALGTQVAKPLRAMVMGAPLEDARHLAQRYDRLRQEAEAQAIEVSRRQTNARETPGNSENVMKLEAKLQDLKSNMGHLGKEAAAAMAAVEAQQQRLTLQRLIAMMFQDNSEQQPEQRSSNRAFYYRLNVLISDVTTFEMKDDLWSGLLVLVTFWFFASMTLILGFFGSADLQLGPNCSRLIRTNPFFVQTIKAQELQGPNFGPMLYGFYSPPPLDVEIAWTETHDTLVRTTYHKEWIYFLNKGSRIDIFYHLKPLGSSPLTLVIAQGRESLVEWIEDPSYGNATLSWNIIYGSGKIQQEISESSSYYIAVGNLNPDDVGVELEFNITSILYNTTQAYYRCSIYNQYCGLELSLLSSSVAVLTSPGPKEVEAERNYHQRILQILDQLEGEMVSERQRIEAPPSPIVDSSMPPPPPYEEVNGIYASQTHNGLSDSMNYFLGEVIFTYQAVSDVELSLSIGDYVVVRKVTNNGWAEGECKGKAGWFPFGYVERRELVLASKVAEVF